MRTPWLLLLAACGAPKQEDSATSSCPVALVAPDTLTWSDVAIGTSTPATVSLVNDCVGTDALSILASVDSAAFTLDLPAISLDPGGVASLAVTFTPSDYAVAAATLTLETNDPAQPVIPIPLTATVDPDADGDGHDALAAGGDDCDDTSSTTYPGAPDTWYDGLDSNCDGADDYDQDADGYPSSAYGGDDCDDTAAATHPGADDPWYDGIDENCDAADDFDQDADGYASSAYGGDDCADTDPTVHPGLPDPWYDGVDSNCDGADDFDQDADGYLSAAYGGDDCDDTTATFHPGAPDAWYDGLDTNCDGADDFDQDADAHPDLAHGGDDCLDTDPGVHPGAADTWYDGVDSNCDGADDYDQDADGHPASTYGGDDCSDTDPFVHPGAADAWYDGVDSNCDGADDYDQDADGYPASTYGGDDCGDNAPEVHPGAADAWYDGIDSDCDGADDYDQDGDGVDVYPTGTDCADTDPSTTTGPAETANGLDDDCDGYVDEGFVAEGDIVITEVLANPAAVSDTVGEWFEVYNPGTYDIDLAGWTVYSDDGGYFVIASTLVVPAGGYAVLGTDANPATNGGVTVDYAYTRTTFAMGDNGDSIYLLSGSTTVAYVSWSSLWPESSGVSMALDDDHLDAAGEADSRMWCASTTRWATGDRGSPGEPNEECGTLDDDHDGVTAATDCDDDDANINPTVPEEPNGIDDNCNDVIDEVYGGIGLSPTVEGASTYSYATVMGVGDYDGDGEVEVVTRDYATATVYLLPGPDYAGWTGGVATNAEAWFRASSAADDLNLRSGAFGDLTGDGIDDLVYAGTGTTTGGWSMFAGPLGGSGGTVAPTVHFEVTTDAVSIYSVESGYDFDGDGVNEVVWANNAAYPTSYATYGGSVGIFPVGGTTGAMDWSDAAVRLNGAGGDGCGTETDPADFNGDGHLDLSIGCYDGDIYLWLGDGLVTTGTLSIPTVATTRIDLAYYLGYNGVVADDLDGDGFADLAWGTYTWSWMLDPGLTPGTLAESTADATSSLYMSAWQGTLDTDGDGVGERLWADWESSTNTGILTFADTAADDGVITGADASWAAYAAGVSYGVGDAADLDGDGTTELLVGSVSGSGYKGTISVLPTGF